MVPARAISVILTLAPLAARFLKWVSSWKVVIVVVLVRRPDPKRAGAPDA